MKATPSLLRLASTHHGMRRILKRPIPTEDYIRKAVKAGVYLDPDAPPQVRTSIDDDGNIVYLKMKNSETKNRKYPIEYEILTLNPPIPPLPKVTKKYLAQQAQAAKKRNVTDRLVQSYLAKKDVFSFDTSTTGNDHDRNVDDYYRKLLGIPAPSPTTVMGQKGALLNKAYAVAMKQQEIMRTNSLSEEESLEIVEKLLQDQTTNERHHSRTVLTKVKDWKQGNGANTGVEKPRQFQQFNDEQNERRPEDATSVPSILHSKPRTIQGISIWSKKLQAIPYQEWTIGASVALDHFIAISVLEISEQTWEALLEGSDPSLRSIGRDIVLTRRMLFPETDTAQGDTEISGSASQDDQELESSIDELLAGLGDFDEDKPQDFKWFPNSDLNLDKMIDELQEWRTKQMATDFNAWSTQDKDKFSLWLKNYVTSLKDESLDQIDWDATRVALLSVPPMTRDASDEFWESIRDQTQAEIFLENLSHKGESNLSLFWELPQEERVRRLTALGGLRPLLDEYADNSKRLAFLERHADKLLEGLELEHIVEDSKGPITGAELLKLTSLRDLDENARYSVKTLPYGSNERGRLLFSEYNRHKVGRARYEERLFKEGKLGLRYSEGVKDEIEE